MKATAETADTATLTRDGLTIVRQRSRRSGKLAKKYTCRIKFQRVVHWITLAETAKDSFPMAVKARREIQAGRWADFREKTALRRVDQVTLGQVFKVYRQFSGADRPLSVTLRLNVHALASIVRDVLGEVNVDAVTLNQLTGEMLWKWKEQKRQQAAAADGDEDSRKVLRSANSRLRQARSIFSDHEDLRAFYRFHKITLPDSILRFCAEPGFSDCAKLEYHPPGDQVIASTFGALEKMSQSETQADLNMFKACWLALGFGLRRGDISAARNAWFKRMDGAVYCMGDALAKNGKFPQIRVQLDAWERLGPLIDGKDPNAFVLAGTVTERGCDTFRRISDWMRSLGWQTTHHCHELRAWAGCQIAMAPGGRGLLDAQVFMRHSHFNTTEQYYGHHLKITLGEVKLNLPQVAAKQFTPVILPAQGRVPTR